MKTTPERLACRCEMWREGPTFYVRPCRLTCESYLYALAKSKERGNTLEVRLE